MPGSAAAIHSVRAVPRDQLARSSRRPPGSRSTSTSPSRSAENDACLAAYGLTPTQVLADAGALGPRTSAVHATHLTDDDVRPPRRRRATYACFCPTTERDLGDGIGPSRALRDAGSPLTLGSDSHAVIDLFEEMRAVELDERLATQQRGHWTAAELLDRRDPARPASAGATPAPSRSGAAPTWSRSPPTACAPPAPAPTSTRPCSRPSRRTSPTSWSTDAWCSARGTGSSSAATWPT